MGMRGYFHRVPADHLPRLLGTPGAIYEALYLADENQKYPECEVDKTWEAILFILIELDYIPSINPISEGRNTGTSFDFGPVWYRTPDEVRTIASTLSPISKEEFKSGYDPKAMAELKLYPDIWDRVEEEEENFEYVWTWYAGMVEFYRAAAAAGDAMLMHLA